MLTRIKCLIVVALLLPCLAFANASLQQVRIGGHGHKARVVFETSEPVSYRFFALEKPNRLVIDFTDTSLKTNLKSVNINNTPITAIRSGKPKPGTLRIVMDLEGNVSAQSQKLAASSNQAPRVVFDIQLLKRAKAKQATAKASKKGAFEPLPTLTKKSTTVKQVKIAKISTTAAAKPSTNNKPKKLAKATKAASTKPLVNLPTGQGSRDVIVVIDPGHGGKDPGAIGAHGTREKTVVLAIAKELKAAIDKEPGMKAVLTRDGNYYVSLRKRLDKARENKGDIFIAIHADAFKSERSHGASVYALSLKGASSEAARWLAEKENFSELGGVNLDGKGDVLRSVLIDLSQTATISSGIHLGHAVVKEMGHVAKLHHRRIEQAPFVVLKSPDIPSILVETGFLSNPNEEMKLRTPKYQKQLANSILKGVKNYFYDQPIPGTYLASQRKKVRRYTIARGDSLSGIAQHYGISVSKIKKANNLQSNRIKIGQTLVIPA